MTAAGSDAAVERAAGIVQAAIADPSRKPVIQSYFDEATFTVSHVVRDPGSPACAIIDSVLDFDAASGRTSGRSSQALVDYVQSHGLRVEWVMETHVHADHLSAGPRLQAALGGRTAIGSAITTVQDVFGDIFNVGSGFRRDGSQFDHLFSDGEAFRIGGLDAIALHVPGHTPACMAYVIGDAIFPGDTLFMPDYGTARCDFPGGSAVMLYRSIQRLLQLPDETCVFVCHDYKAPGRDQYAWETTISDQRSNNIHIGNGTREADFVALREARDATLPMPKLLLPSVQVNMRGGRLPEPEENGTRYLKLPLDAL